MEFKYFLFYLWICFILSFLIGIERQYRRRIIGLRTIILVSIGSFLYVSLSFYLGQTDLTRIAAQVVSGIGFLGAGVIIKDGFKVSGLTTAATLWCCAAIGVLCAAGAIYQAIAGTLVILFANVVLRYVNRVVNNISYNKHAIETYEINMTMEEDVSSKIKQCINNFMKKNSRFNIEIVSLIFSHKNNKFKLQIQIAIRKTYNSSMDNLIDEINHNFDLEKIEIKKILESDGDDEEEL